MSATHEVAEDLCVVHTSHPILSAENLVDFQRFMGELDRESHFGQMWGAVWEVCHLPVPDEVLTHLSLNGRQVPLRRFVCVAPECRRCNQGVGGFQFPFLGPWSRELVCPDLGLSGYEARRALATCRTVMSQEQRVQRSSGVLVTDLIPPPIWRVVFAAELNSLRDRAGARIHEVLAACRCWQQGELLWKDPLVDVPEAEAVFLDPVDRSQRALAAWVLHVAAAPRFLCHMPASSVAHSWRLGQPQVHAGGAGRAPPDWSAWSARAPVTPEGQVVTNPWVERGTLCPGGGREPRLLCFYNLGDGKQQVATLCYKPGPSVRCSSGSGLPGTVSPSRTLGRAGVQEQSFCRVRGSSQGCHVIALGSSFGRWGSHW